jgi:hypothetical protein
MPLRTVAQVAADEGLSTYQVKRALDDGLAYVQLGGRKLIPKSRSPSSSTAAPATTGHVIPLRS